MTAWNRVVFARVGVLFCFVKSFTASANGTRSPAGPGLFGPLRRWIYPRTLRSINVKKATATMTRTNPITLVTGVA